LPTWILFTVCSYAALVKLLAIAPRAPLLDIPPSPRNICETGHILEMFMAYTTRRTLMLFVAAAIGLSAPLRAQDAKLLVPVPPDAQGAMFNDDIKQEMFATSKPAKDVAKFYHDLAQQKGWTETGNVDEATGLANLAYSEKGKLLFNITTIPGGDSLMVAISGPLLGTPE